jgi:mycoredoxin
MDVIKLYSATWCPDCRAAKRVLDEKKIAYQEIDIEKNPEAVPIITAARGKRVVPTLEYHGAFMDGNHFDGIKFEKDLAELLEK